MKKFDITLLCQEKFLNPEEPTPYIQNVLLEDRLLTEALKAEGLKVARTNWDNPNFDFSQTKAVLFRAIWDYFTRFPEFDLWLKQVENQTQLINPSKTIHWNIDKHYLLDLEKSGVNIVPTLYIKADSQATLAYHFEQCKWQKAVVKPAISGSARHTYVITKENLHQHESIFSELIKVESMLLQPFLDSVLQKGEVSHMVFAGKYSHSVLKKAKTGDFRVQDDFGGSLHHYTANTEERAYVEKVLSACHPLPIYARVDVLWDANNELALAELEAIEPELWFRRSETAAPLLAKAIKEVYFS